MIFRVHKVVEGEIFPLMKWEIFIWDLIVFRKVTSIGTAMTRWIVCTMYVKQETNILNNDFRKRCKGQYNWARGKRLCKRDIKHDVSDHENFIHRQYRKFNKKITKLTNGVAQKTNPLRVLPLIACTVNLCCRAEKLISCVEIAQGTDGT